MRDFAGDPVVENVLGEMLRSHPFIDGALGDVDESASRLLHVAAIAAPGAAMEAIERVVLPSTEAQLRVFGPGRREMVWALEVLLWYEETFERAASALLMLAIAESESWSNNATGVLQGSFRVYLGGTSASYTQRLLWARNVLSTNPRTADVLIGGLGLALDTHELRSSTHFGGRTAPQEWRPQVVSEEVAARGGAWDLLVHIAETTAEHIDPVASQLANGLRIALRRGLKDRVFRDLRSISWTPSARSALGEAILTALQHDIDGDSELAGELRRLHADLLGSSLDERVEFVLSSDIWRLAASKEEMISGRPQLLVNLAEELAERGRDAPVRAARQSLDGEPQTVLVLFEEVASALRSDRWMAMLESLEPLPKLAVLGFFRGLTRVFDEGWADRTLDRWLTSSPLSTLVVPGAHLIRATDSRAERVVSAVEAGASSPSELCQLLYGAWVRPLSVNPLTRIVELLAATGEPREVEHALGMLTQWFEERQGLKVGGELAQASLGVVAQAAELPGRRYPMVALYRQRLLERLDTPFETRLQLAIQLFREIDSFPDSHDIKVLEGLAREQPEDTVDAIVRLIVEGSEGRSLAVRYLQDARLLSVLGRVVGREPVLRSIDALPIEDLPALVGHIDFSTDEPDPILVYLLARTDDDQLWGMAAMRFLYPKTAWSGPHSQYLLRRREVAERWLRMPTCSDPMTRWLQLILADLEERVALTARDEAEQGF